MLCLFEMIVFLGFVDTYMVFFNFNLHRGEAVSTIDFIFQLIPAILSKLRNQFTFRHPMIDKNNRKVFDVSCSFAFCLCILWLSWLFFIFRHEGIYCFCLIKENDVTIDFHEADLILNPQFF